MFEEFEEFEESRKYGMSNTPFEVVPIAIGRVD